MPLTPADIYGRKTTNAMHIDMARGESAWSYGVEGLPRLSVWDHTVKGRRTRHWYVDKTPVRNLEAALAVLNGEKTLEEALSEAEQVTPQRPGKLSLDAQIREIDYELAQRTDVYKRIAASNPRRKSELELHVDTMKAVRATLQWLKDNEALIKQRASY